MNCSKCGATLPEGAAFCQNCGERVTAGQQPVEQPVYQQPVEQPVYQQPAEQPVYQQSAEQPVYQQSAEQPVYQQPTYQQYRQQQAEQQYQQPTYQQYQQQSYQPTYQQQNGSPTVSGGAYLAWSIVVTVLCSWPFGIPAIVQAARIGKCNDAGNYEGAAAAAKKSRTWIIVSAVVGFVFAALFFAIGLVGALAENGG